MRTVWQISGPGCTVGGLKWLSGQQPFITSCTNQSACEGTYLVDLFTWLADHNSYANSSSSAVRLAWFTGVDFPGKPLGLYSTYGADKNFNTAYCPNSSNVAGTHSVANAFFWLDWNTACY
jgi:hypothetical protein